MKNIPIHSKSSYLYKLIDKVEKVLKRMRWKALFFGRDQGSISTNVNSNVQHQHIKTFNLKTRKCPPQIQDMKEFEKDIQTMIESIKFRSSQNEFQKKLKEDIKLINSSKNILLSADKTQNFYEIKIEDYEKITHENVTKTFKKSDVSLSKKINKEAKRIAKNFDVADRLNIMAKQECFVTIKDHKEDYRTNPKDRLLNPTKSHLGKISKQVLQNINKTLRSELNVNQWQNSSEVIDWFKNIQNKNLCTFTVFDVQEFYPSITEKLLKDTLAFAQRYVNIEPNELELIFHARRSLLYCKNTAWVKKEGNGEFDVTMGSNDGAETCEIVGLFLLYSIGEMFNKKDIGLYRDDGLACFENNDGHQNDKIRKELIKVFQRNGLKLDIKCNLKVVDYLDITFDLKTGSYKPYRKPNNDTRYINSKSNHPPTILKQIPTAISKQISTNSSNEEIFKNSAPYYNNILKEKGYKEKLQFQPNKHHSTSRRNRSRNITWFNPPYSINVETNVARRFLNLVKKHFSKHRYHKIFNKNNIKVSYSCMDNMEKLVKKHNSNILKKDDTMKRTCNCRVKNECPLDGKCLSSNIVYSAEVLIGNNEQGDLSLV